MVSAEWLLTAFCTGLSFGSVWAIAPVLTSETWPAALFPIIWAWIASTPPIASFLFNRYIGQQYDRQADAAHNCQGRQCWVDGFGMGMAVTALGIGLSVLLVRYSKPGKRPASSTQQPQTAEVKGGVLGLEVT